MCKSIQNVICPTQIKDGTVDQEAFENYVVNKYKDNPDDPWKTVMVDVLKTCASSEGKYTNLNYEL